MSKKLSFDCKRFSPVYESLGSGMLNNKNGHVKYYIFLFVAVTVNYILDLNVQWKVYQRLIKVIEFSTRPEVIRG